MSNRAMDFTVLLDDAVLTNLEEARALNTKVAELFGAKPIFRILEGEAGCLIGGVLYLVSHVMERKIGKPRPLKFYHKRLVEAGVVQQEGIKATQAYLDANCDLTGGDLSLRITGDNGYMIHRYPDKKNGKPHYFMRPCSSK